MSDARFLLDTNIFIEAANKWYPMDIAPGFWDALAAKHHDGLVYTIDEVKREMKDANISKWITALNADDSFVLNHDADSMECYARIMQWVNSNRVYTRANKAAFAGGADGFLVAYAAAHGMAVVTQEALASPGSTQVKIPNLCQQFGVRYISLYQLMRELNVRLVME